MPSRAKKAEIMNPRKRLQCIAAAVCLCAAAGSAHAATSTSAASALIIQPITIVNVTPLDFGAVVSGGSAGTVVITPGSVRSITGGAVLGNAGAAAAAAFAVVGLPSATYSVTLPASIQVADATADHMTVDTFTSNPNGAGTLSVLGAQTLTVGATLHVGANQATGVYTATYDVTVAYN